MTSSAIEPRGVVEPHACIIGGANQLWEWETKWITKFVLKHVRLHGLRNQLTLHLSGLIPRSNARPPRPYNTRYRCKWDFLLWVQRPVEPIDESIAHLAPPSSRTVTEWFANMQTWPMYVPMAKLLPLGHSCKSPRHWKLSNFFHWYLKVTGAALGLVVVGGSRLAHQVFFLVRDQKTRTSQIHKITIDSLCSRMKMSPVFCR